MTTVHRRRAIARAPLAALAALTLAVAACGGAPGGGGPAAPGGSGGAAAVERTPGPSAAPDLAALLPASAGGTEFVVSSFTGNDLEETGISLDEQVLERLAVGAGVTLADVQVAEAQPRDPTRSGTVLAIRVPGADPKRIVDATFSQSKALQLATMGGKSVYNVGASGLNVVVYPKDDVMFQVVGAPKELTEAIVAALP